MTNYELDYLDLVTKTVELGEYRECRNGETRAQFGQTLVIEELEHGMFPILTTRQIFYKGILGELAAFVRGATKISDFKKWGCNYWDENAEAWVGNLGLELKDMSIGQVYGAQWRNWRKSGYDQLQHMLDGLLKDPHGRRHVMTTFDPTEKSCLPPCHLLCQFFASSRGRLDCTVYMRSVDLIHGLPSDVVLYAALMCIVSNYIEMMPGRLTFFLGDTHVYENHVDKFMMLQKNRSLLKMPSYGMMPNSVFDFEPVHLSLFQYNYAEAINYPFNV